MNSPSESFPSAIATEAAESARESNSAAGALGAAAGFLRTYWPRVVAISAAALAPCIWHPHIEAGDLASHVYNAWLVHLIETGQAPGLYLVRQWNNVLFDMMLSGLGSVVGLGAAEKLAASAAVLIFFWGAFALVCAMSRPARQAVPWFLLPCLAMFAYGFSFEMGFLNYYLSVGLAFFALALLVRGRGWERALALVFAPLILLGHPLGLIFLAAAGAYILAAERLSPRAHIFLFAAVAGAIVGAHFYLWARYDVLWHNGSFLFLDGADQLRLYGPRYVTLGHVLEAFVVFCIAADIFARRESSRQEAQPQAARPHLTQPWWAGYLVSAELYLLALLAGLLLPAAIRLPNYPAPVGFLTERLTSVTAILACCALASVAPRKWHFAGFAAIAAVFFVLLYGNTAVLNRMENSAAAYVRVIPPGSRILTTIWRFPDERIFIDHMVDRACVGQCFSYANYEPASGQFRIRARTGNPFVLDTPDDTADAEGGEYQVQPKDLPLFEIYQCDLNMTTLCMRELAADENNGRIGVQPPK